MIDEMPVVVQYGRYDACGAVGGCGDDSAAAGILLRYRQREQIDPCRIGRFEYGIRTAAAESSPHPSTSLLDASLAYIFGALRGTSSPPGSTVSRVLQPCCTHRRITRHTLSSSLRTCTAERMAVSLAHTMSAMFI